MDTEQANNRIDLITTKMTLDGYRLNQYKGKTFWTPYNFLDYQLPSFSNFSENGDCMFLIGKAFVSISYLSIPFDSTTTSYQFITEDLHVLVDVPKIIFEHSTIEKIINNGIVCSGNVGRINDEMIVEDHTDSYLDLKNLFE